MEYDHNTVLAELHLVNVPGMIYYLNDIHICLQTIIDFMLINCYFSLLFQLMKCLLMFYMYLFQTLSQSLSQSPQIFVTKFGTKPSM